MRRSRLAAICLATAVVGAATVGAVGGAAPEPKRGTWHLLGTGADGRSVIIGATLAHGGCTWPEARARRTSVRHVSISVTLGKVDCDFETAELNSGARLTVGLPVKWSVDEVTIGGPGYRGIAADRFLSGGTTRQYPGVLGLSVPIARRVLRANGIDDTAVLGRDAKTGTVRQQWPAAGTTYLRPAPPEVDDDADRVPDPFQFPRATLYAEPRGSYQFPPKYKLTCAILDRLSEAERAGLTSRWEREPGC